MLENKAGAAVILLDDSLFPLPPTAIGQTIGDEITAIGLADEEPVSALVTGSGSSTRPLAPVHPQTFEQADGSLNLCWIRRARGAWNWPDGVDTPLHEEFERYLVGIGEPASPSISWEVFNPDVTVSSSDRIAFSGADIWVRQIGQFGQSHPLLLATLT